MVCACAYQQDRRLIKKLNLKNKKLNFKNKKTFKKYALGNAARLRTAFPTPKDALGNAARCIPSASLWCAYFLNVFLFLIMCNNKTLVAH